MGGLLEVRQRDARSGGAYALFARTLEGRYSNFELSKFPGTTSGAGLRRRAVSAGGGLVSLPDVGVEDRSRLQGLMPGAQSRVPPTR